MEANREIVVLADGDPGFFGIGRVLIRSLGEENVQIHPNVTTLQSAAARLKKPWEDAKAVSLHGRKDVWPLFRALVKNDLVGVFTDPIHHPGRIAEELLQRGVDRFRMHVFENLGAGDEQIRSISLEEARGGSFSPLTFIILERTHGPEIQLRLGLDDSLYFHDIFLLN